MSNAKHVGRVGALTVALGIGISLANTPAVAYAEPADAPSDRTALIIGGTTVPTPDDYLVELTKNQYIAPTHPGQDIEYLAVTTPQQAGPITGFIRLVGIAGLDRVGDVVHAFCSDAAALFRKVSGSAMP